jgi:hypothetical protein
MESNNRKKTTKEVVETLTSANWRPSDLAICCSLFAIYRYKSLSITIGL